LPLAWFDARNSFTHCSENIKGNRMFAEKEMRCA
jgi:hypothetical protein